MTEALVETTPAGQEILERLLQAAAYGDLEQLVGKVSSAFATDRATGDDALRAPSQRAFNLFLAFPELMCPREYRHLMQEIPDSIARQWSSDSTISQQAIEHSHAIASLTGRLDFAAMWLELYSWKIKAVVSRDGDKTDALGGHIGEVLARVADLRVLDQLFVEAAGKVPDPRSFAGMNANEKLSAILDGVASGEELAKRAQVATGFIQMMREADVDEAERLWLTWNQKLCLLCGSAPQWMEAMLPLIAVCASVKDFPMPSAVALMDDPGSELAPDLVCCSPQLLLAWVYSSHPPQLGVQQKLQIAAILENFLAVKHQTGAAPISTDLAGVWDGLSSTNALPMDLYQRIMALDGPAIGRLIHAISFELSQISILERWDTHTPLTWFLLEYSKAPAQARLLRQLLHNASRAFESATKGYGLSSLRKAFPVFDMVSSAEGSREGDPALLKNLVCDLCELHSNEWGALSAIPMADIGKECLHAVLSSGRIDFARQYIDGPLGRESFGLDSEAVKTTVIDFSKEIIDNADSANIDSEFIRLARDCLGLLPRDNQIQQELDLIDASHLLWGLYTKGTAGNSDPSLSSYSGPPLPIQIRLAKDKWQLISDALESNSAAHRKPRIVREVAGLLGCIPRSPASEDANRQGRRDRELGTLPEARLTALLMKSAMVAENYDAAYEFARQLQRSVPKLRKYIYEYDQARNHAFLWGSPGKFATQSAAQQSADGDGDNAISWAADIETICGACMDFARHTNRSGGPELAQRQLQIGSLAISYCPVDKISEMLDEWLVTSRSLGLDPDSSGGQDAYPLPTSHFLDLDRKLIRSVDATAAAIHGDELATPVDLAMMRTHDPEIVKKCLQRVARGQTTTPSRPELLMEYLDFLLTADQKPPTDAARACRDRLYKEIAAQHSRAARETCEQRIYPKIGSTDYAKLRRFYELYLDVVGEDSERAQIKARLTVLSILSEKEILGGAGFDELLYAMTASRGATRRFLSGWLDQSSVFGIISIARQLVALKPLRSLDKQASEDIAGWDAYSLISQVAAWFLSASLPRSGAETAALASFEALAPLMLPADMVGHAQLSVLARRADDTPLPLQFRRRIIEVARAQLGKQRPANAFLDLELILSEYDDLLGHVQALHDLCDPQARAPMHARFIEAFDPATWADELQSASGVSDVGASSSSSSSSSIDSSDSMRHLYSSELLKRVNIDCTKRILLDMIRSRQPAWFVFSAYALSKREYPCFPSVDGEEIDQLFELYWLVFVELAEKSRLDEDFEPIFSKPLEALKALQQGDTRSDLEPMLSAFAARLKAGLLAAIARDWQTDFPPPPQSVCLSDGDRLLIVDFLRTHFDFTDKGGWELRSLQVEFLVEKHWKGLASKQELADPQRHLEIFRRLLDGSATVDQVSALLKIVIEWVQVEVTETAGLSAAEARKNADRYWSGLLEWMVTHGHGCWAANVALVCAATNSSDHLLSESAKSAMFEGLRAVTESSPETLPDVALLSLCMPGGQFVKAYLERIVMLFDSEMGSDIELDVTDPWETSEAAEQDHNGATSCLSANAAGTCGSVEAKNRALSHRPLHLAIVVRGGLAHCVASPDLVREVGSTLFAGPIKWHSLGDLPSPTQAAIDCSTLTSILQSPLAHVERQAHRALYDAVTFLRASPPLQDLAMDWLYSYFGTPLQLRFRKFDAGQLIERLVRVALPVGIDCGYYEKRLTDVAPPASESKAEVAKEKEGQQQQCVGSNDVKEGEVFAEGSGWDEDLEFDISLDDDDNNNNGANNHAGGSKAVEAEGKQETQSLDSQDGGAVETGGDGWDVDVDLDLDLELDEGTTAESNEKEATLRPQDKKGSKDANAGNGGNGWDTDVDLDFDLDDGEDDDGEGAVNADGDNQHHPHRTQPADDGNAPCSATAEEHIISAAAPTIVAGAENARSSDRSSSDTYYNPMSDKCCQTLTVLASNPHLATSPSITRLLLLQTYLVG